MTPSLPRILLTPLEPCPYPYPPSCTPTHRHPPPPTATHRHPPPPTPKAARAKKMGLVDLAVDPNALERSAVAVALEAADGKRRPHKRKAGWMEWALEKTPPGRNMMFGQAAKTVQKASKGKYPAPPAILACARTGLEQGHAAGSKAERERFAELALTAESAALRGLFFGSTACKKNPFGSPKLKVETIAVLGAGLMGAGIAEVSAAKEMRVLLKDRDLKGLSRGESQIAKNLGAKLKKKRSKTNQLSLLPICVCPYAALAPHGTPHGTHSRCFAPPPPYTAPDLTPMMSPLLVDLT